MNGKYYLLNIAGDDRLRLSALLKTPKTNHVTRRLPIQLHHKQSNGKMLNASFDTRISMRFKFCSLLQLVEVKKIAQDK